MNTRMISMPPFRLRANPLHTLGLNFKNTPRAIRDLILHDIAKKILPLSRFYEPERISSFRQISPKQKDEIIAHFHYLDSGGIFSIPYEHRFKREFNIDIIGLFRYLAANDRSPRFPAILDAGCGHGKSAWQLQQSLIDEADVFALDLDLGYYRLPVILGFHESLPFIENELFNMVIGVSSIIDSRAPYSILDEYMRVLVPGGGACLDFVWHDHTRSFYDKFLGFLTDFQSTSFRIFPGGKGSIMLLFVKPFVGINAEFFRSAAAKKGLPLYFLD